MDNQKELFEKVSKIVKDNSLYLVVEMLSRYCAENSSYIGEVLQNENLANNWKKDSKTLAKSLKKIEN